MASMPVQPSRWFPGRSNQSESSTSAQQTPSEDVSPSTNTEPKQLDKPLSRMTSSMSTPKQESISNTTPNPTDATPPSQVRTCWICQQDDTEDTPENNIWRSPCPCTLTAHDSCLLDWIASEEASKPGALADHKIKCPQCQAEIRIQRPKDFIVSAIDGVERVLRALMLPAAASALAGCLYSALIVYGTNAMALVLGRDEARAILGQGSGFTGRIFGNAFSYYAWPTMMDSKLHSFRVVSQLMDPFFPTTFNSTWLVIPPLIAPTLLMMRSKLADRALITALPLYLMQPHHKLTWPPSLGLTLATIPYIHRGYRELYDYTFAEHVKKWNLAAHRHPRDGETAEQIAAADGGEEEAILELEWVEEELMEGEEGDLVDFNAGEVAPNAGLPVVEANDNQHPTNGEEAIPAQNIPQPPPVDGEEHEGVAPQPNPARPNRNGANGHNHAGHNHVGFEADINLRGVAQAALATLFFPAICSVMGDLIKVLLPQTMTVPAGSLIKGAFLRSPEYAQKGLLREKWGRSIVGGCLFVVLKDAVVLYCKWKKAKDFGKRKVLDYVGDRGRRA